MKNANTFGIHYTLRHNRPVNGKFPIYVRITVNKSRCELALKSYLDTNDWITMKGAAKPKNQELKELNSYLEEVRSKLVDMHNGLMKSVLKRGTMKNYYSTA